MTKTRYQCTSNTDRFDEREDSRVSTWKELLIGKDEMKDKAVEPRIYTLDRNSSLHAELVSSTNHTETTS
jgi:hypothetical protein